MTDAGVSYVLASPGDRRDAGRGRRRQGRAPGRAFADRRHPRAGRLLRDDGRVPADHGGGAVDRRTARSAVAPGRGRPGRDPHAQRGDPPDHRSDRPSPTIWRRQITRALARLGEHAAYAVRSSATAEDLPTASFAGQQDTVPERRGTGGDPPAHQPVLGVALHRAGRDLPPTERLRPPEGRHGRGRAADGLPARGRHPVHRRPRHVEPEGRLRGGRLRPRRGAGLRPGERGPLTTVRDGEVVAQGDRHQASRPSTPCPAGGTQEHGDRPGATGPAGADRSAGRCSSRSWDGGSRRTSAAPRTSSGAWSTTASRSSRAGRSRRCSPSPRPTTGRTTCTSPSVTSR